MKKRIFLFLTAAALTVACAGCTGGNNTARSTAKPTEKATATAAAKKVQFTGVVEPEKLEKKIGVTIELTDGRVMKGELYPDLAPITVDNFVKLCKEGFYDGLIFHRVIPDFMIQGGGYDQNNQEKDAESIKGEFASNGVENNLKHTKGVLSMARTQVKDSASSQFFIMQADSPHLDGEYAAFGKITEGIEVIDEIANVETTTIAQGMSDYPVEPIVIKSITVQE